MSTPLQLAHDRNKLRLRTTEAQSAVHKQYPQTYASITLRKRKRWMVTVRCMTTGPSAKGGGGASEIVKRARPDAPFL
jgi:hypothetical protein